jgi:hypothetical protein
LRTAGATDSYFGVTWTDQIFKASGGAYSYRNKLSLKVLRISSVSMIQKDHIMRNCINRSDSKEEKEETPPSSKEKKSQNRINDLLEQQCQTCISSQ